ESERACTPPFAVLVVDLDHEAAELLPGGLRAVDLVQEVTPVTNRGGGQEGLDLLVGEQVREEVDVLPVRPAQPDSVGLDHRAVSRASRRLSATTPEPSATPSRIRAR